MHLAGIIKSKKPLKNSSQGQPLPKVEIGFRKCWFKTIDIIYFKRANYSKDLKIWNKITTVKKYQLFDWINGLEISNKM